MVGVRRVETGNAADETVSVTPLVVGWLAAGLAAIGATLAVTATLPVLDATFLAVVVLTAAAETAAVQLQAGRSALSLSLYEAFVVVALLLLPPSSAVVAVICGLVLSHVIRRMEPQKIAFNLGQQAVAAVAAAAIVSVVPSTPVVSPLRVAAVVVAVLVYGRINALAVAGVLSRLGLASFRDQLTKRPAFLMATSIGHASVGAIAVTMWTSNPEVVWLVAGPVLALYLSYGSSFRIEALLSDARTERDHLDRVVSGVQEGIVLLDADGVVRLWNPAMTRITGVSEGDALGRTSTEVLSGVDADGGTVDPAHALRDHLTTAAYAVALTHVDGTKVDTRVEHTLVDDDHGRCVGDVVLVQDLSREREAHALKEDFVARVSHELRTPLSPLRGYAQILLKSGDRVPAERRTLMLETMVERVGHLERLIEDLLLVSRVSSGDLAQGDEVTFEPVPVDEVAGRAADWVGREHADRDVRVETSGDALVAWADSLRVGQIVTNLVKNACKYATPGTPVDVTVSRADGGVRVDVRDYGPGIPDDKVEAVFDRFHRLEDPQRMTTGGLGLGLYIARHLATAMGGDLTLDSERGIGSTFTLTLPAATDAQALAGAPARRSGSRVYRRDEAMATTP